MPPISDLQSTRMRPIINQAPYQSVSEKDLLPILNDLEMLAASQANTVVTSTVTTTNSTPTNMLTVTIPTDSNLIMIIDMSARSGNNALGGLKRVTAKNVSGTASIVGVTPQEFFSQVADLAITSASFTAVASGSSIIVRVTGVAATTINWTGLITYRTI